MNKLHIFLLMIMTHVVTTQSTMTMFLCGCKTSAVINPTESPSQLAYATRIEELEEEKVDILNQLQAFPRRTPQERKDTQSNPEFKELQQKLRSLNSQIMHLTGKSYA